MIITILNKIRIVELQVINNILGKAFVIEDGKITGIVGADE
jgi:hypothetical protein